MIAALGIDAGSTTTKIVGVDEEGALVYRHIEPSDPVIERQTEALLDAAARESGKALGEIPVVASGYGRNLVNLRGNGRKVTEITCHAAGVFRLIGHGGTLIDIGGQDSKVILITDDGKVANFGMNDKCAAGTGRFLEVTAARLKIPLDEMARIALETKAEVSISSTCTVFAESEIISLIAHGKPLDQIVRGLHRSLIRRVSALALSIGAKPPLMLSGGVAQSAAVKTFLGEELDHEVEIPPHPQLMGAYGAALLALAVPKKPKEI